MSLVGTRLGPYEILAPLGAGGMGEVYRARDSRLGRDVAIKVLPAEFSNDTDRLARFEREARALASLNHPHIGSIYGLEQGSTTHGAHVHALVLELVTGDTLAERLGRGRMPIAEAVATARQIAEALEAAHEQGIVHRDLKPANIKVRPDGAVKVLDFGLAKEVGPATAGPHRDNAGPGSRPADSPTIGSPPGMTEAGVILGTVAYMSPEQTRGLVVDKRTDIWAFGCVLFEMLTGRLAFPGATASDSIAAILGREPDWSLLPATTPPAVMRLVRRCLEKDVKRRVRDLGDVQLLLDEPMPAADAGRPAVARRSTPTWLPWAIAGIAGATTAWLAVSPIVWPTAPAEQAAPMRFEMDSSVALAKSGQFALSPDSRHLVFAGVGVDGILRLWVRSFDSLETRPLPGTEAELVQAIPPMFWSPDSRFIGFFSAGRVKRIARSGGAAEAVCEVPGAAVGGTWNRDDVILVGNAIGGLLRCPAAGGAATPVTARLPGDEQTVHLLPSFLPDGRHFLYLRVSRRSPAENGLFAGDLSVPPERQPTGRLLATGFGAAFVPEREGSGRIVFVRDGALVAVAIDLATLQPRGDAVTVTQSVGSFLDTAFFTATRDLVVYRPPTPDYRLTWFDRRGAVLSSVGAPSDYADLDLAPDGNRIVVARENRLNRVDRDLWIVDSARNTSTRLTSDTMLEDAPTWSADGSAILFAQGGGIGGIRRMSLAGGPASEVVLEEDSSAFSINPTLAAIRATADGRFLVFTAQSSGTAKDDIWAVPLTPGGKPQPIIQESFDQTEASVSWDGKWIAYMSNESGTTEVFARPFSVNGSGVPSAGTPVLLVSRGGGFAPRWRGDSKELFYQSREGRIMGVPVTGSQFGEPAQLFRAAGALTTWGASRDGQRFLLAIPTRPTTETFTMLLNWRSSAQP